MKKITEERLLDKIIAIYNEDPEKFILIEVGANDGRICDRMHKFILKYDPKCILIEPIPDYFKKLKENYKNNTNINFENIAIDTEKNTREMIYIPINKILNNKVTFRVRNPVIQREHWAQGCATFYKSSGNQPEYNVNCLACPELAKHTEPISVNTDTIMNILNKYNIDTTYNIVIQTDTEGHDYKILNSFDFNKVKPKIYIAEIYFHKTRWPSSHKNFNTEYGFYSEEQCNNTVALMESLNYELYTSNDLVAILK